MRTHGIFTTQDITMTDDNTEQCFCNACSKKTWHRIVKSHDVSEHDEDSGISIADSYQILACLGCDHVTYRTRASCSEWSNESGYYYKAIYYPPPVSRQTPDWFDDIPVEIQSVMSEVYVALQAGSRFLATIGTL
jgi:hypothetical protein